MATTLLSFVFIALSVAGLALGVLMGRRPLRGSCGRECDHCRERSPR